MLQFITHSSSSLSYLNGAEIAIAGGCKWVQLRMKEADDDEFISVATPLSKLCKEQGVTFILDDRVHLVKQLHANGVHLGKNDMSVKDARHMLGSEYIIGATANTPADALKAINDGADYLGIGPFRFTSTKKILSPVLGTDGLLNIMKQVREISAIPVVAIGGINIGDIEEIMTTGVSGIAMSGAILNAGDPVEYTREIISIINNG